MDAMVVTRLAKDAIEITLILSLPIMGVGMIVGVIVSLFQAVTQMHEMTMTFVPKIIAVLVSLLLLLPWMIQKMVFYTEQLIGSFSQYAH
jgi:flagellar biosynthesis protein FliQ